MKKIFFSCAALLFCISLSAQNSVNLKLNLEKNKVYRLNSVSEQTIIQTINGNQQTIDSKTNYAISLKTLDLTPDFMITEVHFDTLISNTNTMGKTILVSSATAGNISSSDNSDIMSYVMNKLSKNAVYVKLAYNGKVLEIVNTKMLSDMIMKDTSSISVKGAVREGVKSQIKNLFSDNTLKTMVEMYTYYLPGRQVATGEKWDASVNTNSGGMALDITTNFLLNGIENNFANVTSESSIQAASNAEPMVSGGAKITYDDLKGMSKANLKIDINTGLIVENKSKTHITGNLGVSVQGMNMQIPMDIDGNSRIISLN